MVNELASVALEQAVISNLTTMSERGAVYMRISAHMDVVGRRIPYGELGGALPDQIHVFTGGLLLIPEHLCVVSEVTKARRLGGGSNGGYVRQRVVFISRVRWVEGVSQLASSRNLSGSLWRKFVMSFSASAWRADTKTKNSPGFWHSISHPERDLARRF